MDCMNVECRGSSNDYKLKNYRLIFYWNGYQSPILMMSVEHVRAETESKFAIQRRSNFLQINSFHSIGKASKLNVKIKFSRTKNH